MALVKDPKDYLEVSLREFFDDEENTSIMLKIIHNELMSLRTLDWFVSNYSKKKKHHVHDELWEVIQCFHGIQKSAEELFQKNVRSVQPRRPHCVQGSQRQ